jgi:hypothetical protein
VREAYLRRIEIEHEAVLAVLRAMPLVLAVVGTDGEVVYASDAVANWVVGTEGSWWQRPGPVQVNGRTYAIATETIPINGTPYQLVEFRLA